VSPNPTVGILLLAHGGDPKWNLEIAKLRDQTNPKVPTEAALGMADPVTLQAAIDKLVARGIKEVVAVPLFINTRSEIVDQTRYALGLSSTPSKILREAVERMKGHHHGHHMFSLTQVKATVPIVMAPALDESPLVSRILLERAKSLSRRPSDETVLLVAHGPVDHAAVDSWNASLSHHADYVHREGKFKSVRYIILRDDAAADLRAEAVAQMRHIVTEASQSGQAIVIPVLLASGGIENKIVNDLKGLDYVWDGKTLMPHEGFDEWVLSRASRAELSR
jgi:sirohydrochlorin ferrochelatase